MANVSSNRLIDTLPPRQREVLLSRLQPVSLPVGTVLYPTGERPKYAHFMTSGVASVVTFMSNGVGAEVGLIGREGLVEGINMIGPANAPTTAFIQVDGTALRMPLHELQADLFKPSSSLDRVLEFVQCHSFILSQLAACHGLHEIVERLARWLLMVRDRVEGDSFYLTQEFLAQMLGTRRTSVTEAAGHLQKQELIEYTRGHIRVLNAAGLEYAACECYPVVRDLASRLYH
jgi:CRP-like cAMP-binding protein